MANGKYNEKLGRIAKKVLGGRNPKPRGGARLKRILGMTQRPTTAGQALFGDVDVTGAQTTAREQERLNERLAEAARDGNLGLTGAQMTQDEIRRANRQTPIDRYQGDSRFPKTPELTEEFKLRYKEAVAAAEADAARKRGTRRGSR